MIPQTSLPTPAGVDALGNPTPAAMAASIQPPAQVPAGVNVLADNSAPENNGTLPMPPRVSGGATIGQRIPPSVSQTLLGIGRSAKAALQSNPQAAQQPMGWAKALVGGVLDHISGTLGDAAAADTKESSGALGGIERTIAARQQRLAQEKQQQFENQQKQNINDAAIQRDRLETAHINAQMRQEQVVASRQGAEYFDKQGEDGRKELDTYLTPQEGAPAAKILMGSVESPIPSDKIAQAMKDGKVSGVEHHAIPVGKVDIGPDKDGNPQYEQGYVIVSNLPQVTPSKDWINRYNATHPGDAQLNPDRPAPMPGISFRDLTQQIRNVETATAAAKSAAIDAGDKQRADSINEEYNNFDGASLWMNALAHAKHPGNPDEAYANLMAKANSDPKFAQQYPHLQQDIIRAQGFKDQDDYNKHVDDVRKEAETERHNRADEAQKAQDAKAKKGGYEGDPNAPTPQAFLDSLDPEAKSTVQLIGTGRAPLNNPSYLLARNPAIMEAVSKAYPDFDISKVKSYQDTYKDYTSGPTAKQLKAGGTALGHLAELQQLNNNWSLVPHTREWTAYQNKLDTLAAELAGFYGTDTVSGIASIKETLGATLPQNRNAAINTQAQSMSDRFNSLEAAWKNAAPSSAYEAPMPNISLQAQQARAKLDPTYAQAHPELGIKNQQQPTSQQNQVPVGARPITNKKTGQVVGYQDSNGNVVRF
jgi:hypothetical protein